MTATKATPAVRTELVRLLNIVPVGLSADAMAQISRLDRAAVAAALGELEAAGDVVGGTIMSRGKVLTIWRRR